MLSFEFGVIILDLMNVGDKRYPSFLMSQLSPALRPRGRCPSYFGGIASSIRGGILPVHVPLLLSPLSSLLCPAYPPPFPAYSLLFSPIPAYYFGGI